MGNHWQHPALSLTIQLISLVVRLAIKVHGVTRLTIMFSSLTAPLQEVHLEVVPIVRKNHEVNLTAVVLPTEANLTIFYWWIGDNLQVNFVHQLSIILIPLKAAAES